MARWLFVTKKAPMKQIGLSLSLLTKFLALLIIVSHNQDGAEVKRDVEARSPNVLVVVVHDQHQLFFSHR